MATSGKDTGIVGYNVQTAVDTKNHLIVAHEVTNVGTDRHQLLNMAQQARTEMGVETLDAVADRGYYEATEMALNVLAYNMKRVMMIVGVGGLLEAMRA
jgi:hypothetical protein